VAGAKQAQSKTEQETMAPDTSRGPHLNQSWQKLIQEEFWHGLCRFHPWIHESYETNLHSVIEMQYYIKLTNIMRKWKLGCFYFAVSTKTLQGLGD